MKHFHFPIVDFFCHKLIFMFIIFALVINIVCLWLHPIWVDSLSDSECLVLMRSFIKNLIVAHSSKNLVELLNIISRRGILSGSPLYFFCRSPEHDKALHTLSILINLNVSVLISHFFIIFSCCLLMFFAFPQFQITTPGKSFYFLQIRTPLAAF